MIGWRIGYKMFMKALIKLNSFIPHTSQTNNMCPYFKISELSLSTPEVGQPSSSMSCSLLSMDIGHSTVHRNCFH